MLQLTQLGTTAVAAKIYAVLCCLENPRWLAKKIAI